MAQTQQKTDWTPIVIIFGLMTVGKIFGKNAEDKAAEAAVIKLETAALANNPFAYKTFQLAPKAGAYRFSLTPIAAQDAAKQIYKGVQGYTLMGVSFSEYEDEITGGIKKAGTKSDIVLIAANYDNLYHSDLYATIKKYLSSTELGDIDNYVNKLPNYITNGVLA